MEATRKNRGMPVPETRTHPSVSVVVPTVGRGSLDRCLEALRAQTLAPHEIVVVEDTDRRGPSWARNEGIRRSTGEVVAFTDDDCVPPPNWLEVLTGALDRFGAEVAGGGQEETDPRLGVGGRVRPLPAEEAVDRDGLVHNTANLMIRRSALDRLVARDGFAFDESLRQAEDNEIAWRLRRRGSVVVWSPVPVLHLRRVSSWGYLRLRFARGRGNAAFHRIQKAAIACGDIDGNVVPPPNRSIAKKIIRNFWLFAIGPLDAFGKEPLPIALLYWLGGKAHFAGMATEFLCDITRSRR